MKKWITLTICILFLLLTNAHSLTRGEIRNEIRKLLNDVPTATYRLKYSDTLLNLRINTVQNEIVRYTNCISSTCYITSSANVREYTLPSNYLEAERVSYLITTTTGTYKKLECVRQTGLDVDNTNWENYAAGLPLRYYIVVRSNVRKIGLDPKPSSSYAGANYLKLEFYCLPDEMDSDTDVPFNGLNHLYPFHELIIYGVMKKFDRTYVQDYALGLQLMVQILANKPDWQPDFKFKLSE